MTNSIMIKLIIRFLVYLNKIYENSLFYKTIDWFANQWKSSIIYRLFSNCFKSLQSINFAEGSIFFRFIYWLAKIIMFCLTKIVGVFKPKKSVTYKIMSSATDKTKPALKESLIYKLFYD